MDQPKGAAPAEARRGSGVTGVRIHPTALVEDGVEIGAGSSVWDSVHIRRGAKIGADCIVGEKSYIAYDVVVGDRCKINAFVYICAGVTLETGVMASAGTIFTNDRFPRATTPDLSALRSSAPDEHTLQTLVREGATLGAGCRIGPGLTVGRFAMVGMGSVVTKSVGDFLLVVGNPARAVGAVCRCGNAIARFPKNSPPQDLTAACNECGRNYTITDGVVRENA
jgi:UDP-2-acetamido-3-amino-2,3-dideoxy-glucuronate N-acetyltransferase